MNERVFYVPFNALLGLYRDSNPRRDETKDDSPFRHTLVGCVHTLAMALRVSWPRVLTTTPWRHSKPLGRVVNDSVFVSYTYCATINHLRMINYL